MRHGIEEVIGHRQPYDVERFVTADQHHASQQGRTDIVGMGRAAVQRFAHHGELHQLLARKRTAQQFVDTIDRRSRRRGARPDTAAGSNLLDQFDFDTHGTAVCFEHGPHRGRNDVTLDILGELHPTAVADFKSFGILLDTYFQHIAHSVERKAHYVETASQIRNRSRRENLNIFHNIFFDELNYRCLISCFRSRQPRPEHAYMYATDIDY